ncbi:MAG: MBL fold metallo-hydrolase [Candidatus Aenigmarchaeota archaeon]|nr:MBL fold metallo-hydrolase [Candidatus Aenigmarchaeota archaeon]
MKIIPLAFDSMGVRSMSTLCITKDIIIHIDPGVALGPSRYGLEPSNQEYEALDLSRELIMEVCEKFAKVVIVTHYHYDHHPFPDDSEMYERCFKGKFVIAKNILKDIHGSGKKRGRIFEKNIKNLANKIEWGDGREFKFVKTIVSISDAVWHGDVGSKVGKVIMVFVKRGKDSFLFGSDAQGLADPKALKWVIEKNPKFMILDGYPTIFVGWKMSKKAFENSKENLKKALEETEVKTVILEHHGIRDINYREKLKDVFEFAERLDKKILTAAEYLGIDNLFLEAWRKKIYQKEIKVDVEKYYKKLKKRIFELIKK